MKGLLIIIAYSVLLSLSMSGARAKQQNNKLIHHLPDSVNFASHIMPLLKKECSPCHFDGGKMYEKMPFDKAATLIHHHTGILKRFSDRNEKAILEKFIREHTAK